MRIDYDVVMCKLSEVAPNRVTHLLQKIRPTCEHVVFTSHETLLEFIVIREIIPSSYVHYLVPTQRRVVITLSSIVPRSKLNCHLEVIE
jgi:hypothetical protein